MQDDVLSILKGTVDTELDVGIISVEVWWWNQALEKGG
jgi:hypothetical protein